jgi:hypothetical protein
MKAKIANPRRLDILGNGDLSSNRESSTAMLKQWRQKLGYYSIFATIPAMLVSHVQEVRADEAKKPEVSVAGRTASLRERLNKNYSNPALLKRQSEYRLPHQKGSFDMLAALAGNDDCPGRAIPGGNYTAAAPYSESGDTTGANDTVTRVLNPSYYYYYSYDAHGPDHVYSFTLTGRGPNPQIQVSTTSGTYRPLIYVLQGGSAGPCPAGTGNLAYNEMVVSDSRWTTGSTATLDNYQVGYLPLNVPLYLFVDSANNDASGSGSYTIRMQDVTIAPAASPNPNPIDSAGSFVRQHYIDFLNREPDNGGLAYWTNIITECGSDLRCIHERRIGVSAAFFIEQEFQDTGFYVYRFYKASFGRQPNYTEFTSDRGKVIGGAGLETNMQAFADGWVQRPAFVAAYPITMSNTEVVNKLFDSAGLTSSTYDALRQQEILALNAGRSRALVVRDVIEIADFKNIPDPNDPRYSEIKQISQYNPAFVLMQYFGYLHRDLDRTGYDFWLDVVNNRQPNNYRSMVCAFITSTEYQLRFGSQITRSNADCGQ